MRNKVAKAIKRKIYGDLSTKDRGYVNGEKLSNNAVVTYGTSILGTTGTLHTDENRRAYRKAKRGH